MAITWDHPKLGTLNRTTRTWRGQLSAPGFDAFSYDSGLRNAGPPTGTYSLHISGSAAKAEAPPEVAVALALKLLADPTRLVSVIADALWEEFNGRGPDSDMWWYGALLRPDDARAFDPRPTRAAEVPPLLQLSAILIRQDVSGYHGYIAHLCFKAAFEQEHDVGILTDGDRVIGTGSLEDPTPYGFRYEE